MTIDIPIFIAWTSSGLYYNERTISRDRIDLPIPTGSPPGLTIVTSQNDHDEAVGLCELWLKN